MPSSVISDAERRDPLAHIGLDLGIDGSAGRQDVVERPGRSDRLAHGELHQPVQRRGEIVRRRRELPCVGDAAWKAVSVTQRDPVPGQDLLRGDLDWLGPQIDLGDPDRAADLLLSLIFVVALII